MRIIASLGLAGALLALTAPATFACDAQPSSDAVHQWDYLTQPISDAYGVPPALTDRVIQVESGGDSSAESPSGAMGLMQVMGYNFQPWEDPWSPADNIRAGVRVLAQGYQDTGSWDGALAEYLGVGGSDAEGSTDSSYLASVCN